MGGIDITSYEVYWTDTNFPYEPLFIDTPPFKLNYLHVNMNSTPDAGNTLDFATNPIVGGATYKFKYLAVNVHGKSTYSAETSIIASTKPDQQPAPTTTLSNATVIVSW